MTLAKEITEDWYLALRGKFNRGELLNEKMFIYACEQFQLEYEVVTDDERSPKWVASHKARIRLLPFFGKLGLCQVTGKGARVSG